MILLQNATGDVCRAQMYATRFHHERDNDLRIFEHGAPRGWAPQWGKVAMWLHWLASAREGEEALGLDTDGIVLRPISNALSPGTDIGLVRARDGAQAWLNTGAVYMRKRGEKLARFFEHVLRVGPQKGFMPGEQAAVNVALRHTDVRLAVLPNEYNTYIFAPHPRPLVAAFHGVLDKTAILEGLCRFCR